MAGYKCRQQVRVGFLCKQELADRLESFSKEMGMPMTEVIRQAVEAFLDGADQV